MFMLFVRVGPFTVKSAQQMEVSIVSKLMYKCAHRSSLRLMATGELQHPLLPD